MIFHCFVAICLVLECVGMNEGFLITPPQFSLRSGSFLLSYTMRTILSMFLLGNWVFRALICEAVIFHKIRSAGVHAGQLSRLHTQYYLGNNHHACSCDLHIPIMMSLIGFACDVNHVGMTSFMFAFHSHHAP